MTFKINGIDIGAIGLDKCYFRLVFHCISLYCTVYEILALIFQNCKRSRNPECTSYCRTLTCVMAVLFTFNLQTKFEMSSCIRSKDMAHTHTRLTDLCLGLPKDMAWAQKCRNGSRDLDNAHFGIVSRHKANTSCGQMLYEIWSL